MVDAPKILDTDYLDEAYPKINKAIDNANEAIKTANLTLNEFNKPIEPSRIDGVEALTPSANLLTASLVTTGKRIATAANFPDGGEVYVSDSNWGYTDYIAAAANDIFTNKGGLSVNAVSAMFYDVNKKPIAASINTIAWVSPLTITTPNDSRIKYARFNLVINNTPASSQMIVKGSTYPSDFIENTGGTYLVSWLGLKNNIITMPKLSAELQTIINNLKSEIRKLYFPRKVYGIVGRPVKVYYRSVVSAPNLNSLFYKSSYKDGIFKIREDHYVRTEYSSGVRPDTFFICDANTGKQIDTVTFNIVHTDPATKVNPSTEKNIICFGDSFTQAGYFSREINDYLVTQRGWSNYKFIGRKTSFGVKHQGMGGYAIHDFVIPPEQMRTGFTENPFRNPTTLKLDFKYYMSNNGFTGDIDYMFLEHGVNDLLAYSRTPEQIVSDLKLFINQLHLDYPNCKVFLCGLVPASPINDFYNAYMHNIDVLNINKAYDDFSVETNYSSFVTYVPVAAGFNVEYGYPYEMQPAYRNATELKKVLTDYLHPNEPGYCMEADQMIAAFLAEL
ncbi:SGNH/GDSL hydrolase family protein [Niallia sp. Man26]|uniref:SGNH/GDSL hydrolase family protein n=1 Tax=Niallia sp. Man26 TaxID=2912824 RepID=UPI001EDA0B37|nr:SGNH/GDSL hydrolase family protein [Niallia sp. Man26]UPO88341.1 SGNH/GDSL hydrolase family protein [Niallia sp. Man26]